VAGLTNWQGLQQEKDGQQQLARATTAGDLQFGIPPVVPVSPHIGNKVLACSCTPFCLKILNSSLVLVLTCTFFIFFTKKMLSYSIFFYLMEKIQHLF
jgi:hypothetical protein